MVLLPNFPIVVRPKGGLSEPSVLLVETPDLVHHGVRGGLREDDGLGHVVIVRPPPSVSYQSANSQQAVSSNRNTTIVKFKIFRNF